MIGRKWSIQKRILFVILIGIFVIPLLIMTLLPELYIIIFFSIILGSGAWYVIGILTPFFTGLYIELHKKFNTMFDFSREISLVENKTYHADNFWETFYKALSESFFPTIIAFSIIGYVLRNSGTVSSPNVFLVLIFGPVIVSFIIPLRILQDSKLYYIDRDNKEIISLCREINVRLKSIGGLMALGLFLLTLYTVSGDINETFNNLVVYFSFTYPTITLTSYLYYDRWHREFTERVNMEGEVSDINDFVLGLFKE